MPGLFNSSYPSTHTHMARTVTTLSVHPDRAERLHNIKRQEGLPSLDAALAAVLEEVDTKA